MPESQPIFEAESHQVRMSQRVPMQGTSPCTKESSQNLRTEPELDGVGSNRWLQLPRNQGRPECACFVAVRVINSCSLFLKQFFVVGSL